MGKSKSALSKQQMRSSERKETSSHQETGKSTKDLLGIFSTVEYRDESTCESEFKYCFTEKGTNATLSYEVRTPDNCSDDCELDIGHALRKNVLIKCPDLLEQGEGPLPTDIVTKDNYMSGHGISDFKFLDYTVGAATRKMGASVNATESSRICMSAATQPVREWTDYGQLIMLGATLGSVAVAVGVIALCCREVSKRNAAKESEQPATESTSLLTASA